MPACVPLSRHRQSSDLPACTSVAPRTPADLRDPSWEMRIHFYLFPTLILAHVSLQTFLDFNVIYISIEVATNLRFPNPDALEVPGSGRNWVGAVAYFACWVL
ncbi:hypothetical protein F5888DRAFT_1695073 [Russula emetica]|nr:hypothetical protein F5888DRAFT_1695073 [Russula emetica]